MLMKTLFSNWNLFRVLRLVLGIVAIIQGFADNETIFAVAGGLITLMAIGNIGCCGASRCAVNTKPVSKKNETAVYEEVGRSK